MKLAREIIVYVNKQTFTDLQPLNDVSVVLG